jgi:hypothetical protein
MLAVRIEIAPQSLTVERDLEPIEIRLDLKAAFADIDPRRR